MASPNLSELITTTLRNRSKALADNITNNNAILARFKQKGRIRIADGGRDIVEPLEYAENGTAMWYSGYEQLNITPSDVISAATYDWKQCAVAVSISGLEQMQNSGKSQLIDLLRARIGNAERTMANTIATGLYADGTGSSSKEIGGLQLLVADSPSTGTVGGINRANFSFWQNVSFDCSSDGTGAASSTLIQGYMNTVHNRLVRGNDAPDLILADNNYYNFYLGSLQTIQRVTSDTMAKAGFVSLKYMHADVVLDGGVGTLCPDDHMYFLNTNYLHYRPHAQRNMVPLEPERYSTNQDAVVKLIGWMGNMTMSNASLQGVLKA